jgi:hypothetical protein
LKQLASGNLQNGIRYAGNHETLRRILHSSSTLSQSFQLYAPEPATVGIGQSSSVMLDQNTQTITTASKVKSDSNSPPLILPFVPVQICTLIILEDLADSEEDSCTHKVD